MEYAEESKETTYFDEEAAGAKEAVEGREHRISENHYPVFDRGEIRNVCRLPLGSGDVGGDRKSLLQSPR